MRGRDGRAEQVGREAELRPNESPKVNVEETVTDKGYHSGAVVKRMKAYEVCSYHSGEETEGAADWAGQASGATSGVCEPAAGAGRVRQEFTAAAGEFVERSFAHCYETGGMRRCHLRLRGGNQDPVMASFIL